MRKTTLWVAGVGLAFALGACGDGNVQCEDNGTCGSDAGHDAATLQDAAADDASVPDMTVPRDMASADMASADMASADMGVLPDMATADMAEPDMAESDMGTVCEPLVEICNGLDDDCDGETDEGTKLTFYRDEDGDGFGVTTETVEACWSPDGYAELPEECAEGGADCGAPCDIDTEYCGDCRDGIRNADETSIDRGGRCTPTGLVVEYPSAVRAGAAQQLRVLITSESGEPLPCNGLPTVITTSDAAVRTPTMPIVTSRSMCVFPLTLLTEGLQSITVTVDELVETVTTQVGDTNDGIEPGVTPIVVPSPDRFTQIPSVNTFADDYALEGGISMGDAIYFFANSGTGAKLYSYDLTNGVRQLSNTNPNGADHTWAGGFRAVGGVIYFDALNAEGCVKIYKYAPGDAMVTTPMVDINTYECRTLPTQVATRPGDAWGVGTAGSLSARGSDLEVPGVFDPVAVDGRIYFAATNGERQAIYEYVPGVPGVAIRITDFRWSVLENTFVLGEDDGVLLFSGPEGIYEFTPGGDVVRESDYVSDTYPVSYDIGRSVRIGNTAYYAAYDWVGGGYRKLLAWSPGDTSPRAISNVIPDGNDDIADLMHVGEILGFSALDASGDRRIYQFSPALGGVVTVPAGDPCGGGGCELASQAIGAIDGTLYFNARDENGNLKFYSTSLSGAERPFTINTAADDHAEMFAVVGETPYFLAFTGVLGHTSGTKYPNFAAVDGARVGVSGTYDLYTLASGSTTPVKVFQSARYEAGDQDNDEYKHPQLFATTSDAVYFLVWEDVGGGAYDYQLYRHGVGDSGLVTTPINTDFAVDRESESVAIGATLYFVGNTEDGAKLFAHSGSGALEATDAISNIHPGHSDEPSLLTNVGGVLVFKARNASGHEKLFRFVEGGDAVTSGDARSDIFSGDDDKLTWLAHDVVGGDASARDGVLLLTAGDGDYGFVYDPRSPDVLELGDAIVVTGTRGRYLTSHDGAYYGVDYGDAVVDGFVYGGHTRGGGSVDYAQRGVALTDLTDGPVPVDYFAISSGGGPREYVRRCEVYGDNRFVIEGVLYVMVYIPGTDTCSYLATTPTNESEPFYTMPFPGIGAVQTQGGTLGPADPLRYDAESGITFLRGAVYTRQSARMLATHKLFALENGKLTLLSRSRTGMDAASMGHVAGASIYFSADACGGMSDYENGGPAYSCRHVYKYMR